MPFAEFETIWSGWKQYRKEEHNFKYKSANTEMAALKKLQELSNHDKDTARRIIEQSIANGWRGLFAVKGSDAKAKGITDADRDKFAEYLRTGRV